MTVSKSYGVDNLTIANALNVDSAIYSIPQFQRRYAWTKKEIDDLLFGLFEDLDWSNEDLSGLPPHFLGSIVIATVDESAMVLDGQQRLTSISLLLAVIKRKLIEESSDKASDIDQYLIKASRRRREENQVRIQLQPEDADTYKLLVRDPTKHKVKELSSSLLAKAARATIEKVEEYISKAKAVGVSSETALVSMHERTLDYTTLVRITAPSEADAFRLFETLNDRGLALNAADLIKNKLLARCQNNVDDAVEIWKKIVSSVGEDEIVNFLRYYWIAFHANVRQRELYKAFEKHLGEFISPKALDFARSLRDSAIMYGKIADPSQSNQIWKSEVHEVLKKLAVYKARSCRPVLLACAKHRHNDMLKVATACEVITVRYSITSNLGSNDLDGSYARLARDLKDTRRDVSEVLEAHLSVHALPDEDFARNFSGISVSNVSEVWRQILVQLNDELSTGETAVRDAQKVHVEHIFPQKPSEDALRESQIRGNEAGKSFSCMIGNLTLLSGDLNRKASNHAFSIKKPSFKNSEIALNKDVANATKWGEQEITERSKALSQLAINVWPWPVK